MNHGTQRVLVVVASVALVGFILLSFGLVALAVLRGE
ncbi:hypothetical protein J2S57_000825 [Kineosporia succinea]|uniref:Uncharacterized protein n=1 Tax=Kineosporia succinea TaxID=84632 RepID=A0ABT9NXL6_9ACTN|nr:hypothetical protein [Kineosporia succinea]